MLAFLKRLGESAKESRGVSAVLVMLFLPVIFVGVHYLTQYRIEEALLKGALRGHTNVSLMFYQKYYFEEDLKTILEIELSIYKNMGYRVKMEKKESPTQGIYYKVRIEW